MLPDASTVLPDTSKDCFARDKFSDYRDDMGGVGTFTRQNRTLYVGRIKETGTGPETEEVVKRHFKEWGEIEKSTCRSVKVQQAELMMFLHSVRVLQYRSVAFVTYVHECNAQFAKESMACQSLDNDEILNVRWATEDPNPVSKVTEKRRLEDMGREAIQARMDPRIVDAVRAIRALEDGVELEDDGLTAEDMEDVDDAPDAKRRRLEIEDGFSTATPPSILAPSKQTGLLSADTLESLKYFTEIRQRNAQVTKMAAAAPTKPFTTGLGLGGYGSDEDDD